MKVNVDLIDILEYKNLTAKNQAWEAILAHLKTQFQQNNLQKFGLTSSKAVYSYWRNLRDISWKKEGSKRKFRY